jgi:hypothetical protein
VPLRLARLFSLVYSRPTGVPPLEAYLLLYYLALCSQYPDPRGKGLVGRDPNMAAASETHPTERALSSNDFEGLLLKAWEIVQTQKALGEKNVKIVHPFEANSESPSWT